MAITTTDDDVYKYIISIMEAIHKLPKNTKWESTKPKAQAINTGPGAGDSVPNEGKGKGKGKGKNKGTPLPNGKGKGGKGKGKGKSQSTSKSSTPAPEGKGQSKGTATPGGKSSGGTGGKPSGDNVKKEPKQCVFYASPAGCIRGKSCPFLHQNDSVTWMGTEDTRTYFAQEIRDLHQHRQFADVDDSEVMEVFHEITEQDLRTSDDLRAEVSLLKTEQEDKLDETRTPRRGVGIPSSGGYSSLGRPGCCRPILQVSFHWIWKGYGIP